MNHDQLEELMALGALGDLEDATLLASERAAHGPDCAKCLLIEAQNADAVAALAMTLDPVDLTESMVDDILASPGARPAVVAPVADFASHKDRARKGASRRVLVTAAAVVLLAGVLGGGALYLGGSDQRQLNTFLAEPGTQVYPFETESQGTLEVATNPDEGRVFVVAEDIQPMNDGQTYQLWMITGKGKPVPGPTFTPEDGDVLESYDVSTSGADVMAVTVEPTGGSPQPTTDPIFVAELT